MTEKRGRPPKGSVPLADSELTAPILINPRKIEVEQKELEDTRAELREFYLKRGYQGDIELKIEYVIRGCIEGWNRCPKTFQQRVDKKTQRNTQAWTYIEQHNADKRKVREEKLRMDDVSDEVLKEEGLDKRPDSKYSETLLGGITLDDLFKAAALGEEERLFYLEREKAYRSEFDFNISSDEAILQQLITDEVIMRRVRYAMLKGKDITTEVAVDKLSNRIRENQIKLGITREQRERERSGTGGNIAEVSVRLESRLKSIKSIQDKAKQAEIIDRILERFAGVTVEELEQYAEELYFMRLKELRKPPNVLPADADVIKLTEEMGVL